MTIRQVWDEAVKARPDHPFLVCENPDTGEVETYTYAHMDWRVNRRIALLRHKGMLPGDRVAIQLGNEVSFVEFFLALAKSGGVLVPISCDCTCRETGKIFEVASPSILVCHARSLDSEGQWRAGEFGGEIIVTEEHPLGDFSAADSCECEEKADPLPDLRGDSLFEIMFTSGTTGTPKGVMLTHENAVFSGRYVNWELAMSQDDKYLTSMVATHVNLQFSALLPVITAQATLILEKRYSACKFWDSVRAHKATLVQAMAMIARTMLLQPEKPGEKDHSVRYVHYFLPLTDEEYEEFTSRFDVQLLNNYGSTECLIGAVTDFPNEPGRWPSVGKVGPGYELRIIKRDGTQAQTGEYGEIQLRGKLGVSLMAGYYGRDDLTEQTIRDSWYATGDCGYVDEEGWLYFVDRYSDLIKRAGENISAREVEEALLAHPGVAEVAVVAVPDPIRDEAVKAVVVPQKGYEITQEELVETARESLADFKIPTVFEFRTELPRGEYGKVRKSVLKGSSTP